MLGAGLQGTCVALAARRLGLHVHLFDQHARPFEGASLHNEGKVHLGYVYAKDPQGATHQLMVHGALAFAREIDRLSGIKPDQYLSESRFTYAVPDDSQLGVAEIAAHFDAVQQLVAQVTGDDPALYLGRDPLAGFGRMGDCRGIDGGAVRAAWMTPERAVNTERLASTLRNVIAADKGIGFLGGREVKAIDWRGDRPVVESCGASGTERRVYDAVVNCLWEGRLPLDQSAGMSNDRPCLHRYKAYLRFRAEPLAQDDLPSTTLVLGPYGDLVNYGGGEYYLSWYPTFRLGETLSPDGRGLHQLAKRVDISMLLQSGMRAMGKFLPALRELRPEAGSIRLRGGVISAWGRSDIDDLASELHSRADIGPEQSGRYITVNTGKLTTAPLFARDVQSRLAEIFQDSRQVARAQP